MFPRAIGLLSTSRPPPSMAGSRATATAPSALPQTSPAQRPSPSSTVCWAAYPFAYIHSEKDILKLVTTLIANTTGNAKSGDDFWVKAETLLYTALIGYIYYEGKGEEKCFSTLIEMINAMEVHEDDEEFQNNVDLMFEELEKEKPNHFAVRQYKKYKLAAGKTAKAKTPKKPQRTNQLLIDIQEKLAQGKGAGYAYWAKKFNLKQMAQTVAYLQDHGLMDYAALTEKADAASVRYHELSDRIKAAENHMAEIAVLRTQIINYAKTRDTYVAYRKAGYSKMFLAEHEGDILLHKTAKKHFDGLGLKKLPTVKTLNAEYAALLAEKKAAYGEYRNAREDMKELLTAKANIDRILGKEVTERNAQKEKETDQR